MGKPPAPYCATCMASPKYPPKSYCPPGICYCNHEACPAFKVTRPIKYQRLSSKPSRAALAWEGKNFETWLER